MSDYSVILKDPAFREMVSAILTEQLVKQTNPLMEVLRACAVDLGDPRWAKRRKLHRREMRAARRARKQRRGWA